MAAPVVETIRPGVTFTPAAGASFRRAERAWGRRIDVNSTYRDWNTQWGWYVAWNAYVAGRGPYPGHSRAIHPDLSVHCQGRALDSDDWRTPGFIKHMAEHGWIRTAASDPTEQHHFEYQSWRDQHLNEPAGDNGTPIIEEEEDDMELIYLRPIVNGVLDTGVKGVIGDINMKFTQATRGYFFDLWGTPEKPRYDRVHISYRDVDVRDLPAILNMHAGGPVPAVAAPDVKALAAALAPLLAGGATADQIAAKVDAILQDAFAAVVDAIPTEFTITGK